MATHNTDFSALRNDIAAHMIALIAWQTNLNDFKQILDIEQANIAALTV
jgi:hypothetical protein